MKPCLVLLLLFNSLFLISQNETAIIDDSLVLKHNIREVRRYFFTDTTQKGAAGITTDSYDELGRLRKTSHLNVSTHHHVFEYDYKEVRGRTKVFLTTTFYDWNPYQRPDGDTIKKVRKKSYFPQPDNSCKVMQTTVAKTPDGRSLRTVQSKCETHTVVSYYKDEKLIAKEELMSLHNEEPVLFRRDSLFYNSSGRLQTQRFYTGFRKGIHDHEATIQFEYSGEGLLQRQLTSSHYLGSNARPQTSMFRYEYELYQK
jgi:hypothetical protein